jgi:hypothetical protein
LNSSTFNSNEKQQLVYGSFFGVEFARDAEMQSTLFQTTQENIAYYLNKTWNSHEALQIWEKPTCIVNSGSHDIGIRAITRDLFVSNVKWYTSLLAEQCDTIIWIATTSPRSDDENIQSKGATLSWNSGVQKMLEETPVLQDKSAFIDVFEPSITYEHVDNSKFLDEFQCGCWVLESSGHRLLRELPSIEILLNFFASVLQFTWMTAGTPLFRNSLKRACTNVLPKHIDLECNGK